MLIGLAARTVIARAAMAPAMPSEAVLAAIIIVLVAAIIALLTLGRTVGLRLSATAGDEGGQAADVILAAVRAARIAEIAALALLRIMTRLVILLRASAVLLRLLIVLIGLLHIGLRLVDARRMRLVLTLHRLVVAVVVKAVVGRALRRATLALLRLLIVLRVLLPELLLRRRD